MFEGRNRFNKVTKWTIEQIKWTKSRKDFFPWVGLPEKN